MKIPTLLKFKGYFDKYPPGGTTYAELLSYLTNQNEMMEVFTFYSWQPLVYFEAKRMVLSPNMPAGFCAIASKPGKSGNVEPVWSKGTTEYTDGGVTWTLKSITSSVTVDGIKADENDNITLPFMKGATGSAAGTGGKIPAPKMGENNKAFFGNGFYQPVVQTVNGKAPDPEGNINVVGLPIGFEYFTFDDANKLPWNTIAYQGEIFQRSKYSELYELMKSKGRVIPESRWQEIAARDNGNVALYSDGDGSTTFRAPCITCYLRGSNTIQGARTYIPEGLPEIYGSFPIDYSDNLYTEKAFKPGQDAQNHKSKTIHTVSNPGSSRAAMHFSASNSNPIYGKYSAVVPKTMTCTYCVIALDARPVIKQASPMLMSAIPQTQEAPAAKRFIVETGRNGMNWYEKNNDGWVRQGGCTADTVQLLQEMADTNYTIITNNSVTNITSSSFEFLEKDREQYWTVEGQGK